MATQSDIAKQVGVSRNTVSRALRGEDGISDDTRTRILETARAAGLPLPPSRKLARNGDLRHVLCAIGLDDAMAKIKEGDEWTFHVRIREGLLRGTCECAGEMIFCRENLESSSWPIVVARKHVDGVAMFCGDEHMLPDMPPCPVPQVYIFHGPPHADVVTVSNFRGALELGRCLAAHGHRRVAFIGPDTEMASERLAGLRTGLAPSAGACPDDLVRLKRFAGGHEPEHADGLLAGETRPEVIRRRFTAIACYNDWFAVHAVGRLRQAGLRVPEDVSVTGFDDVIPSWYDGPKLTTCAVPLEELGAEAARLIYWRIEHPNAIRRTLTLEADLVEGESVGTVIGKQ